MATLQGVKGRNGAFMSSYGNAWCADDSVAVPAGAATNDKARILFVPAGVRITDLSFINTDLDSGSTVVASAGYEAANPDSALVADPAYFIATNNFLRSQGKTSAVVTPITFDEDVWITLTITTGPTTTAGTVAAIAYGQCVGNK